MRKASRATSDYHLERAIQERKRAYAANCREALEAHLRLAELHDHERALAMYQEHIRAINTAETRDRMHTAIQGLTLALYRVD